MSGRGANPKTLALAIAAALLVGLHGAARAQESVFSLEFLGMSDETGDVRARGLGVYGIALPDAQSAITLNPARHAMLPRMTLSVMGLAGVRTSREPGKESRRGFARFPHQRFALPVPGDLVMSVGLVGVRNFASDFQLRPRQVDGITYVQTFERSGTLYTVPVGVARSFGPRLHLGATLDFTLGTADESWISIGDSLVASRTRRRDTYSGQGATLGVLAKPLTWLHVGFTASPSVKMDRSEHTTLEDPRIPSESSTYRESTVLTQVQFPATLRAGVAVDFGPYCTASADAVRRDWAAYDGRLYGAEALGLESRIAAGVEFRPMARLWWGRTAYRLGLSRATWPQRVGGNPVRETTVHFGTGLDLRGRMGRLDLGFEYARIGAMESNGREESQFRFLLGFSGQEAWKRRATD